MAANTMIGSDKSIHEGELNNMEPSYNEEQMSYIRSQAPRINVQAGPGSGKTHSTIGRILWDQSNGCDPLKQIVITYTVAAAKEIQNRLAKHGAKIGFAGTTLAFCLRFIRLNPLASGYTDGCSVIEEEESDEILKSCASSMGVKDIAACRRAKTATTARTKFELVAKAHRSKLRKMDVLDFDTMVAEMRLLLMSRAIPQCDCLYVDEFQDCSLAEAELWTAYPAKTIAVIGDKDQRIYEWRGMGDPYDVVGDSWEGITLRRNHRSSQEVCKLADAVMHDGEAMNIPVSGRHGEAILQSFKSPADAAQWAVDRSRRIVEAGQTCCVISRLNDTCKALRLVAGLDEPPPRSTKQEADDRRMAASAISIVGGSRSPSEPWFIANGWKGAWGQDILDHRGIEEPAIHNMGLTQKQRIIADRAISLYPNPEQAIASLFDSSTEVEDLHIGTVHSVKGREFDFVIIHGVGDDAWDHQKEEHRRLLYVAITRARFGVYLTHWQEPSGVTKLLKR